MRLKGCVRKELGSSLKSFRLVVVASWDQLPFMAESGGDSAPDDSLLCSICTGILSDPRVLPCGHSYCGPPKNCLDIIVLDNGLKCALCKGFHNLNKSDLKPLFGIRDYIHQATKPAVRRKSKKFKAPFCSLHDDTSVTFRCKTCNLDVCAECIDDGKHDEHSLRSFKKHLQDLVGKKLTECEKDIPKLEKQIAGFLGKSEDKIREFKPKLTEVESCKAALLLQKVAIDDYLESQSMLKEFVSNSGTDIDISVINSFLKLPISLPNVSCLVPKKVEPGFLFANYSRFYIRSDKCVEILGSNSVLIGKHVFSISALQNKSKDGRSFLGLRFTCLGTPPNTDDWKLRVKVKFALLTKTKTKDGVHRIQEFQKEFSKKDGMHGLNVLLWSQLLDPVNEWLNKDDSFDVNCLVSLL